MRFNYFKKEGVRTDGMDTGEKLSDMEKLGYEKVYDYKVYDLRKLDEQYNLSWTPKVNSGPGTKAKLGKKRDLCRCKERFTTISDFASI